MQISRITSLVCNAAMRNWVFVRVDTNVPGLVGWGEATLEWKTRAVVGAIDDLAPLVIGLDPRDVEQCFQVLTRHGFWRLGVIGMSAISGIEMALWDILGKDLGRAGLAAPGRQVPGVAARLYPTSAWGDMGSVYETSGRTELAERGPRRGRGGLRRRQGRAHSIRAPCRVPTATSTAWATHSRGSGRRSGPDVDIMVDFHGRPASVALAREFIGAVGPCRPLFIEEPLPPEDMDGLADLTASSGVRIAAGERLIGRCDFAEALRRRAFHVAQPDICHVGGLGETKKIAAMCEAAGVGRGAPQPTWADRRGWRRSTSASPRPNVIIQEENVGRGALVRRRRGLADPAPTRPMGTAREGRASASRSTRPRSPGTRSSRRSSTPGTPSWPMARWWTGERRSRAAPRPARRQSGPW